MRTLRHFVEGTPPPPENSPEAVTAFLSRARHVQLDALTLTKPAQRGMTDCMRREILDDLKGKVTEACRKAKDVVDHHIAHAGTAESLASMQAAGVPLSLDQLWSTQRSLCEVSAFLASNILGTGWTNSLPAFDEDLFAHIGRTFELSSDGEREVRQLWHKLKQECLDWQSWAPTSCSTVIGTMPD